MLTFTVNLLDGTSGKPLAAASQNSPVLKLYADNARYLRNLLECPVCNEFFLKNIFMCQRGHIICSKCRLRCKKKCPSCKGSISDIRPFAVESFAENVQLAYQFEEYKCLFSGTVRSLRKHEPICTKNPSSHEEDQNRENFFCWVSMASPTCRTNRGGRDHSTAERTAACRPQFASISARPSIALRVVCVRYVVSDCGSSSRCPQILMPPRSLAPTT
ncbi:hypothetical protein JTB14_011760 [Gonioctena quinquepunctata]|nr:hypothetical protein JTB14_011760 [Gonioctena quinquepunctata]